MQQWLKFKVFSVNKINTIYLSYVKYISNAYTCYLKNHKEEISTFIDGLLFAEKSTNKKFSFYKCIPFVTPNILYPWLHRLVDTTVFQSFYIVIFKINLCTILLIIENTYKKYVPRIEVCTKKFYYPNGSDFVIETNVT